MAALEIAEIKPGLVAFMDWPMLAEDPEVHQTRPGLSDSIRPFVCVEQKNGFSTWLALTSRYRYERLLLRPAWLYGGQGTWQATDCYLADAAMLFIGPNRSFASASHRERSTRANRAWVDQRALYAIRAEMVKERDRIETNYADTDLEHTEDAMAPTEETNTPVPSLRSSQRAVIVYRQLRGFDRYISSVYPLPDDMDEAAAEQTAAQLVTYEREWLSKILVEFTTAEWSSEVCDFRPMPAGIV